MRRPSPGQSRTIRPGTRRGLVAARAPDAARAPPSVVQGGAESAGRLTPARSAPRGADALRSPDTPTHRADPVRMRYTQSSGILGRREEREAQERARHRVRGHRLPHRARGSPRHPGAPEPRRLRRPAHLRRPARRLRVLGAVPAFARQLATRATARSRRSASRGGGQGFPPLNLCQNVSLAPS